MNGCVELFFFFSSRRRHTRWTGDWSSDVCSSDLRNPKLPYEQSLATKMPPEFMVRRLHGSGTHRSVTPRSVTHRSVTPATSYHSLTNPRPERCPAKVDAAFRFLI